MKSYKSLYFDELESTNKYLKENYNLLPNFTFVSTSYQSKGKGREERIWNANKGENLLFSLLLKNPKFVSKGGYMSLIASYSVANILEKKYHLNNVEIKWPNDIYVNDKKICGILLEGNIPNYLIIGIGLNVNQENFDGEYRKTPTSISLEKKEKINLEILKEAIYDALFMDITFEKDCIRYFNSHNYLGNKMVKVNDVIGQVTGVDDKYNLIIKDQNNMTHLISSGEIEIIQYFII